MGKIKVDLFEHLKVFHDNERNLIKCCSNFVAKSPCWLCSVIKLVDSHCVSFQMPIEEEYDLDDVDLDEMPDIKTEL